MSTDKRSEVHLVNALVGKSAKTAGVRKDSNAYVKLNMRQMHDDGIELHISEESEVIFTKGQRRDGQDVIDPKYLVEVRLMNGDQFWPPQSRCWNRRALAGPRIPSLTPPVKRKATPALGDDEEETEEVARKAPFSVFGTETAVAVVYKRPPETPPPPIVMPVRAESIPTVYKVPPSDPPLSLGPMSGVPRAYPTIL